MEAPPPREPLPVDLQLEIVAHSDDAATILRCAAATKPLRSAIFGSGFLPRRRLALRAAVNAGFDLALLLGVSHASTEYGSDGIVQPSRRLRFDTSLLRSTFEPVSSRNGLLVLWRQEPEPELRICNTFTGHVTSLPRMDVEGKWGNGGIYHPALLTVDGAGRSFELLVMDVCLRTRIFSSRNGEWGPIRVVKPPPDHNNWCVIEQAMHTSPAVIGRNVHWISRSTRSADMFILALHADAAPATSIELPQGCLGSTGSCTLAATADGKLSVVVPETEVISMWTLSVEGWSREVVISKRGVNRQITPGMDVCFVGFAEWSGAMLFWIEGVGLVQLNLGTKKAIVCNEGDKSGVAPACLHEIDLVSLLQEA